VDPDQLLDPEYRFFRDEVSSEWTLSNLAAIRTRIHATFKPAERARGEQHWVREPANANDLRLCLYRPRHGADAHALPAILYVHGGGFVLGCPEMADDYLADLAIESGALIVAVDYRLAPEHPFPAPLEDCYRGLQWLVRQQAALGVDPERIVIMGHSAGGGLAAALSLLARDRGEISVAGSVLIYPMLDQRTGAAGAPVQNPSAGTFSWSREANQFCWQCYRGEYPSDYRGDDDRAMLFSPALATDLSHLPPSFIAVGALDLFVDEDMAWAGQLSRSGVAVELHVYPGVPHMFDLHPGAVTEQCKTDVVRALKKMLGR
jgi:acetyl esterase/lipase